MLVLGTVACGEPEPDGAGGAPPGTPAPVVTPVEGLTPTEYTAPDGRPLYYECIQKGLPLPPEIPTPTGFLASPTPAEPGFDPNQGKEAPGPEESGTADLHDRAASDSTGWEQYESRCYGYSLLIGPGWEWTGFVNSGYQQGEVATVQSPDRTIKVDISAVHSPYVDFVTQKEQLGGLQDNEYMLRAAQPIEANGMTGLEHRVVATTGTEPSIHSGVVYRLREDWFLSFSIFAKSPYSDQYLADLRAMIESVAAK